MCEEIVDENHNIANSDASNKGFSLHYKESDGTDNVSTTSDEVNANGKDKGLFYALCVLTLIN